MFGFTPLRRFFKDMPKNIFKKGCYRGYAYRHWLFKDSMLYYSKRKYNRLLFVYLSARYIAWKLDLESLDKEDKECGIYWGIKNLAIK